MLSRVSCHTSVLFYRIKELFHDFIFFQPSEAVNDNTFLFCFVFFSIQLSISESYGLSENFSFCTPKFELMYYLLSKAEYGMTISKLTI